MPNPKLEVLTPQNLHSTLKVYRGLPHGVCTTNPEIINPELLAFIKT
jgi:hypothetical protein